MSPSVPPNKDRERRRLRARQTAMVERWAYCAQLDLLHRLYHHGSLNADAVSAWQRLLSEELALQLEACWVPGAAGGLDEGVCCEH